MHDRDHDHGGLVAGGMRIVGGRSPAGDRSSRDQAAERW
jgi:hypothetical protein